MEGPGEYLHSQRESLGLGVREAEKLIGISHQRLIELERGSSYATGKATLPRKDVVKAIAAAYCLSEPLLLTLAGYSGADPLALASDHLEVLMLYDALPPERKSLALATLRVFASVARPAPAENIDEATER